MSNTALSRNDRIALMQFLQGIKEFRKIAPEMRLHTAQIFLEIALSEEASSNAIMARADVGQSSCSRNLYTLSSIPHRGKVGLGLIDYREDPQYRRRKLSKLTPKGYDFAVTLAKKLK